MRNSFFISVLLAFSLTFINGIFKKNQIKIISPKRFKTEIVKNDVQLIDVRTQKEYDEEHIGNASLLNVMDSLLFVNGIDDYDKSKPVYLYCRSGVRSHKAAIIFHDKGYKVFELKGGFLNWKKKNYPVEK